MAEETQHHGNRTLAVNKKARFNYAIDEKIECGIELRGTEVKSMKSARFSFSDSYARIRDGELYLAGFHISPYEQGSLFNHDPDRERKLLAHRAEIAKLERKIDEKGYTLVPLRFFLTRGIVKIELGLGKGKKMYDKRETIKGRDMQLDSDRELRRR